MSAEALAYDLYLPTLGGGERYLLSMAEIVARHLSIEVAAPRLPDEARMRQLGIPHDLSHRRLHPAAFVPASRGRQLVIYLANGVPLPSLADRSVAIVQFPMRSLGGAKLGQAIQQRILDRYELVAYSTYVQRWIERRWDRTATVIPPAVKLGNYDEAGKEPIILAVGRFFAVQHSKRQDILIRAFRQLVATTGMDWTLILVGGMQPAPGTKAFIDRLRADAVGMDVRFVMDATAEDLRDLYNRARLFWHAAGYDRSADAPERAEHFGMSTVEAMSYGAVPLVYDDGGQPEILAGGGGLLWKSIDELVSHTQRLVENDQARRVLAAAAEVAAGPFGPDRFQRSVSELLQLG